ncbi:hypothetical protein GGR28_003493 [Lewinella aquimaris]|uniref:YD repeat-containing protein n=1 Tax=Neolewinella aquimaris TaxID=1835722 RepID=A0A840E5D6_9BACT|nr:hypothetical protein [Neolewinella aquimaris]MBB4080854.1 hypothetical protein [Neolewinella aquimaris]
MTSLKNTFTLLILLSVIGATACQDERSGVGNLTNEEYGYTSLHIDENLKGPVKTIVYKSYQTDQDYTIQQPGHKYSWHKDYTRTFAYDGQLVEDDIVLSDNGVRSKHLFKFDEYGEPLLDSSATKYIVYKYNADNQLVFEGNPYSHEIYNYEDDYLISRLEIEDGDTIYVGRYYTVEDTVYQVVQAGHDTLGVEVSVRNDYGLPLYLGEFDFNDSGEVTVTEYNDESIIKVKETWQSLEQGVVTGMIVTLFEQGNETQTIEYNADGSIQFKESIKYTYDDYGNWVEQYINYNDKRFYKVVRAIEYY